METEIARGTCPQCQFELHYQPMIDAKTGRSSAVEAFVRWHHPSRGMLPPDQFLSLAESTGLMAAARRVDLCNRRARMRRLGLRMSGLPLTCLLPSSARRTCSTSSCALLVESGLSPDRLAIEIADRSMLERHQGTHLLTIRQLKNIGVSIVLDDCGTGHSSATYLTAFPFDKVKIDKSFTQGSLAGVTARPSLLRWSRWRAASTSRQPPKA